MIKPKPKKQKKERIVEEIMEERKEPEKKPQNDMQYLPQKPKISIKEKTIVAFLWLIISICGISFLLSVILHILKHEATAEISKIFSYSFSTLIGYFLGTNKESG
jgi:uncharacterized membrane protein (DUF106 family)